jgi:hypothetical protein
MPMDDQNKIKGAITEYVMPKRLRVSKLQNPRGCGRKHTNHSNVSVDRENTAPRNGTEAGPLLVHGSRRLGQEFVQKRKDEETNNLSNNASGNSETLDDEVRNVEIRCRWQRRGENGEDLSRLLSNLHKGCRGCVGKGFDQEHLDELEEKVRILSKQLNAGLRYFAGESGAQSHDDGNQRHEDGEGHCWEQTRHNSENRLSFD